MPPLLDRLVYLSNVLADYWLDDAASGVYLPDLAQWAEEYCELGPSDFDAVMQKVASLLPGYAPLFEVDLPGEQEAAHLLAEARDLLMLRNLKTMHEAIRYKSRNEALEARNRKLEQQNHTDPLTGLNNRRRLTELMEREFNLASLEGWPLSVGFLDIDHFKKINDVHGHQAGDSVLMAFSHKLTELMRQSDIVARYGGEEFVILLPGSAEEDAFALLERLRLNIGETSYTVGQEQVSVTVSIGLASLNHAASPYGAFETPDEMLRAADRALYAAKRDGRNRTVHYRSKSGLG